MHFAIEKDFIFLQLRVMINRTTVGIVLQVSRWTCISSSRGLNRMPHHTASVYLSLFKKQQKSLWEYLYYFKRKVWELWFFFKNFSCVYYCQHSSWFILVGVQWYQLLLAPTNDGFFHLLFPGLYFILFLQSPSLTLVPGEDDTSSLSLFLLPFLVVPGDLPAMAEAAH